jgi:hypothetical protein
MPTNSSEKNPVKVALLLSFVGKYHSLANKLVNSIEQYFCVDEPLVHYRVFVFTDSGDHAMFKKPFVTKVAITRLGWPHDSMLRPKYYLQHRALWSASDFVFSLDADLLFASNVCLDILAPRVGVLVPWFYQVRGS